ncbi:MAG: uracil-xanthine permease, partial [Clostridia bacterium]|nr:uracil-xanthine permease [Clostridia bacterium]
MNLVYGIKDKPKFSQLLIFAFQQVLAILAATIAVPAIVGNGMSASAALFGAGVGTIVYQLFTKFRSPVFLGSSFVFIGPMAAAFGGAVSASAGFAGLIIGAVFAGLVYVVIALIVKFAGVKWIDKVMPPVVIGPTVALIGLSLAGAAINDVFSYGAKTSFGTSSYFVMNTTTWVSMICALVTLFVVVLASTFGKKMVKLVPFIIGILAGYAVAAIFTVCGIPVIDFSLFENLKIVAVPEFSFMEAMKGVKDIDGSYIATVAVAYIPVAFVVFAEHLADHKNLSTIIDQNLIEEPGLHRTLLGDGVGSIAGAFFGGCPNTTYGESVGCVAITRNASVITITTTAIMCIILSFISPVMVILQTIPACVMGGVCL